MPPGDEALHLSGVPTSQTGMRAMRGPAKEIVKSGLCAAHSSMKIAASTPLPAAPPTAAGIRPLRKPRPTAFSNTGRASSARVSGSGPAPTVAARSRRCSAANPGRRP